MNCPHCQSTLLWSEDRGAHCDGCDQFDESSLAPVAGSPQARIEQLEAEVKALRKLARTKRQPIKGIGGVVQRLREDRLMTLSDVAQRSGLSKGLVCNIERGRLQNPGWSTIKRLADALTITPMLLVAEFVHAENNKTEAR